MNRNAGYLALAHLGLTITAVVVLFVVKEKKVAAGFGFLFVLFFLINVCGLWIRGVVKKWVRQRTYRYLFGDLRYPYGGPRRPPRWVEWAPDVVGLAICCFCPMVLIWEGLSVGEKAGFSREKLGLELFLGVVSLVGACVLADLLEHWASGKPEEPDITTMASIVIVVAWIAMLSWLVYKAIVVQGF